MKIKNLLFILTIALFMCCKNEAHKSNVVKQSEKEYFLDLYFPDTVNIRNIYEGEIIYKSALDTITTKLFVKGDSLRMLTLYLKSNIKLIQDDYDHILRSNKVDTFIPYTSDKIVFKYKFERLGVNYLEGVLEDEIYFKESDTSKLRIITKYNHIILPVFVTDDETIIDSYFRPEGIKLPIRI